MSLDLDRRRLPAVMRELAEFQIEALQERLDADPADSAYRVELAQVLAGAGRYDEAIVQLKELLRRAHGNIN